MSRQSMSRRAMAVVLAVATVTVPVGSVSAAPEPAAHCISPSGTDLNAFWEVSEAIIAPWCLEIEGGQQWRIAQAWFMNTRFRQVPPGFEPAGATPLEDFLAKVVGVKYVVDAGTAQESTFVFTNVGDLGVLPEAGKYAVVQGLTIGAVHPLAQGSHTVDSYFSMRALHCDGLGRRIEEHCLPAGDTLYDHLVIEVK